LFVLDNVKASVEKKFLFDLLCISIDYMSPASGRQASIISAVNGVFYALLFPYCSASLWLLLSYKLKIWRDGYERVLVLCIVVIL